MFCAREQTAEANEKGEWEDKSKDTFVYCQKIKIERERSIDWVSPSLTAFRNAAKKRRRNKRRTRERDKQASKSQNPFHEDQTETSDWNKKKEEREKKLGAIFWMLLNSKMFTIFLRYVFLLTCYNDDDDDNDMI